MAIQRGHEVWCITARLPGMKAEVHAVVAPVLGAHRILFVLCRLLLPVAFIFFKDGINVMLCKQRYISDPKT